MWLSGISLDNLSAKSFSVILVPKHRWGGGFDSCICSRGGHTGFITQIYPYNEIITIFVTKETDYVIPAALYHHAEDYPSGRPDQRGHRWLLCAGEPAFACRRENGQKPSGKRTGTREIRERPRKQRTRRRFSAASIPVTESLVLTSIPAKPEAAVRNSRSKPSLPTSAAEAKDRRTVCRPEPPHRCSRKRIR